MPTYVFKDLPNQNAPATLASAIDDDDTTITLTTGTGTLLPSPTGGDLAACRIEQELITYDTRTTDTLTGVTRGVGGTTAVAHSAGKQVRNVAIADFYNNAGGGGGSVATDAIWDAAGDLAVGTGADTAAKLAMGSALQVLRVNAGGTALEYAAASGSGALTLLADSGELGIAAATIDFTSISGSYKSLELEWDVRGDTAAGFASVLLRINNDSTGAYDWQQTFANNTTTFNALTNGDTSIKVGVMPASTATASLFGVGRVQVPNYASTHHKKALQSQCFEAQDASTGLLAGIWGGQWRTSGTAIDRLTLLPSAGSFAAGSRALLWGRS